MDNYIEYIATGKCNQFQNIFYTALATDIKVAINGVETTEYTWLYGLKYIKLNTTPADGDRVRITNINLVVDPDPDLEILRNDVSANEQDIISLENAIALLQGKDTSLDGDISDLEAKDTAQDTSINNLSSDAVVRDTVIAGLINDMDAVELKADNNETAIAGLSDQATNIADLQGRMTAAEAEIINIGNYTVANRDLILENKTNIATLKTKYNQLAHGYGMLNNNVTVDMTVSPEGDDLIIDANECYSATLKLELIRKDDTEQRIANVELAFVWDGTAWVSQLIETTSLVGAHPEVTFTFVNNPVTKTVAVSYTTSDMTGANYEGSYRFKLDKTVHTL
jgi:hypothetical protein